MQELSKDLAQAAENLGVQVHFYDIFGKEHHASTEVLEAILRSIGERKNEANRLAPPTLVVDSGSAFLPLSLPKNASGEMVDVKLELEDGSVRRIRFEPKQGEAAVPLGSDLPLGYHKLEVEVAGHQASTRLVVCPTRAYQPDWLERGKTAGIAVSLYGVRSDRNWGCGDCTDLHGLIDWIAEEAGASFIALNPLHTLANRQPYNTSPYLPVSIFYRNHIYLDLEKIEDFRPSEAAQQQLPELREAQYVEYERIGRLKLRVLKAMFRRFLREYRADTERALAFKAYVDREGSLLDRFATYMALDEAMHKANPDVWNWRSWPAHFQDPHSAQTEQFAKSHWRSVLFHKYIQWLLDLQFSEAQHYAKQRGLGIGLYHDLALATDRFGADLWAYRQFYADGCRVGSPPDHFSPKGQDWSFPPPNSQQHFEDGYRLFAESIRKASAHGGALRIDHVMRFFRLYWIPDGKDATEGTYVSDRYEDLVRVLALESVRGKFLVVGEDLGTVPDIARETLRKFGVFSYRLFFFERDNGGRFYRPDEYPEQALVSASTHDLPTLAGFWQSSDIEDRKRAGVIADDQGYRHALAERAADKQKMLDLLRQLHLLPAWFPGDARHVPELAGELHSAIVGLLAMTESRLLVINQEDLFKDTEQQNLPGTTAEHPNWRHKMRYKVEELGSESVRGYTLMFRSWLERTGRGRHMK